MSKVSIVGAGRVGAATCHLMARTGLTEVVLVDIADGLAEGEALDIAQSLAVEGIDAHLLGTQDFREIGGSDLVIVTAGSPRKPGMTREDLLHKNADIISSVAEQIALRAPNSTVCVVTNPVDVMTYLTLKKTGFAPERVFGQAGVLDSGRFRLFLAKEMGVSVKDVTAMVLGGHGDSMVSIPAYTTVSGIPVTERIPSDSLDRITRRTREAGAEVVGLMKTGSAYRGPAAAAVQMAQAFLLDSKRVMPTSAYLSGQYGVHDVYLGVPARLGAGGVEEILELLLSPQELCDLQASATFYREQNSKLRV